MITLTGRNNHHWSNQEQPTDDSELTKAAKALSTQLYHVFIACGEILMKITVPYNEYDDP
jgi:hypothetical protein